MDRMQWTEFNQKKEGINWKEFNGQSSMHFITSKECNGKNSIERMQWKEFILESRHYIERVHWKEFSIDEYFKQKVNSFQKTFDEYF